MAVFVVDKRKKPLMPSACIGEVGALNGWQVPTLPLKATGRGTYRRTEVVHGFQTGDMVRAEVPEPLKTAGIHVGRVKVRSTGSFKIGLASGGTVDGINWKRCRLLHRADGYAMSAAPVPPAGGPLSLPTAQAGGHLAEFR